MPSDPLQRSEPSELLLSRDFVLLLCAQTIFGLAFSTFLLMPKYLEIELDASPSEIGTISGAFGLSAMVLMPLVGSWADRTRRLPWAIAGCLVMAVTSLGFLLVREMGPLVYALRLGQGVANSFEFVAVGALVTDLAPRLRMGQALGLFGLTMLSTNAVAPALAEWTAGRYGWSPVFLAAGVVSVAGAAMMLPIHERRQRPGVDDHVPSLWQVAARRRTAWFVSISFLMGIAFGVMFTFIQPLALELGRKTVSDFFIGYTITAMLARAGLGNLGDRWGRQRVSALSMALYAVPIFLTLAADSSWLPWLGGLFGLAHGLLFPAFNALVLDGVGDHERGKVFALFIAAFNAGWALGGIGLGLLAQRSGYRSVFLWAGVGVLLALTLLLSARRAEDSGNTAAATP